MNAATSNEIDDLLDSTLDDLADMPTFNVFPAGAHRVTFDWESKEVNNKPAIELKFKAIETLELVDAEKDKPVTAGDESNILLLMKNNDGKVNEFSQGTLKEVIKSLVITFPGNSNREILDAAKGAEIMIVTKLRENKNNPGTFNMVLNKLEVI